MEPIISPWIVYLIDITSKLAVLSTITAIISGMVLCTFSIIYFVDDTITDSDKKHAERMISYIKKVLYVFIVSVFLAVFVPAKDTIIAMVAVSFITPENIIVTEDHIVELINKIMEVINK